MYLPCSKKIYSAFDFVWNMLSSKIYGPSQVAAPQEAVPAVEVVHKPPPLFALIIGINEYISEEFKDLRGAVSDAQDVVAYLERSLGVPTIQIKTLFNKEATREAIITSLRDLQHDSRINRGDPILIYYAGHGSLAEAPAGWERAGWEPGGPKIQILVSHDALCDSNGHIIHGIPDRTIGFLLEQLAQEKDDNITVIFDCCHSGSLTRQVLSSGSDPILVRSVKMPVKIPLELDEDIWGGNRGTAIPQKIGLRSHVLLSACSAKETAREEDGHGYFTKGLLNALERVGADKVTYADLVRKIRDIPWQSPQCEGHNQHRIWFDSKAPVRSSRMYPVRKVDQKYVVDAGTIHGIADGATFGLYNDRSTVSTQSPVAILIASRVEGISTDLSPSPDSPPFEISEEAVALLIRAGEQEYLRIHLTSDEKLTRIFEDLANEMQVYEPAEPRFILAKKETAELDIVSVDNHVVFNILDPLVATYGLTRIPFSVPATPGAIGLVINKAARYFWHLRRTGSAGASQGNVKIEFTRLEEEHDAEFGVVRKPCGRDLVNNGIIDIVVEEKAIYGIKLTNKSGKPLYPSLFYFDNSDFSITSYFQSPTSPRSVDPPLPPYEDIKIGYGSGGGAPFIYTFYEGQDVDVGFLKLFLSTEPVDLSGIEQCSPFQWGIEQSASQRTRGLRKRKGGPGAGWSTLLIPIIQRRYPSIQSVSF